MKKIFSTLLGIIMLGSVAFAQNDRPADHKMEGHKKEGKAPVGQGPHHDMHHNEAKHMKKDGTPDRRFKENKQHVKKDGTPDKRYKENKMKGGDKDRMGK